MRDSGVAAAAPGPALARGPLDHRRQGARRDPPRLEPRLQGRLLPPRGHRLRRRRRPLPPRHGFNTVRLGVIYKALEPKPPAPTAKPRYATDTCAAIERTQRLLARHGIYTLLDFHQDLYNERFQGEGWPDWQVLDDGLPSEPQVRVPGQLPRQRRAQRAFDNFWANARGRRRRPPGPLRRRPGATSPSASEDAADCSATTSSTSPGPGTGYPSCVSPTGCPLFDTQTLEPFSERVIAAIREADRRTLVWYAPLVVFDFGADSSHGDTGRRAGRIRVQHVLPRRRLPAGEPGRRASCGQTYELTLDNADEQSERDRRRAADDRVRRDERHRRGRRGQRARRRAHGRLAAVALLRVRRPDDRRHRRAVGRRRPARAAARRERQPRTSCVVERPARTRRPSPGPRSATASTTRPAPSS